MSKSVYNFTQPSYSVFVYNVFGTIVRSWEELNHTDKLPSQWWRLIRKYGSVTTNDIVLVLVFAIIWTLLRFFITSYVLKPFISFSKLSGAEAVKAPESAWKFIFYSCTWSYSVYILFYTDHNYFHDVSSTFVGWKIDATVPTIIYVAYLVQISFYVHSVYATLFVDVWRKDSIVMMLHHFVTLFLISFSYIFRYTKIGILILFLHDITDIVLEGTKLTVYYKTKGGWYHTVFDALSTVGFVMFGVAWFVFRLYWFPLKAMYATGYISKTVATDIVFYHFFNTLLWILLAMNIYWFMFIVKMGFRLLTKPSTEIDDTREYQTTSKAKKVSVPALCFLKFCNDVGFFDFYLGTYSCYCLLMFCLFNDVIKSVCNPLIYVSPLVERVQKTATSNHKTEADMV